MQTAERISGLILLLGALAIPFGLVGFSIARDSQPQPSPICRQPKD